jgi:hypothetical protein
MTTSSSMREAIRGFICVDTVRLVEGPNGMELTGGPLRRAQPPHAGRPC